MKSKPKLLGNLWVLPEHFPVWDKREGKSMGKVVFD